MKVLLRPFAGWSSIQMPSASFPVSYIDDLPEILFQLIEDYQKKDCAVSVFDAEGWHWIIILSQYAIDIISYEEIEPKLIHYDIDPKDFCKQLLKDLEEDEGDWIWTYCNPIDDPGEYEVFYNWYNERLEYLKNLIKK